jgi:glycosyltransferase involved in cell wall biosynthesis
MRICLSMIVRNESVIIKRLLSSVLGFVDEYCICDTGSTDNTVEVIESFTALTGRIYKEPFVNFEVNRTNALREAQKSGADYILLLDADMVLVHDVDFDKSSLTLHVYSVFQQSSNGLKYSNVRLVKGDATLCKYVGVTHEYFDSAGLEVGEVTKGLRIQDLGDGGCKTDKFERDIRLLERALSTDKNNDRYRFYLGNSYFDTQQFEKAIEQYTLRINLGGWNEEVYFAMHRMALAHKGLKQEDEFLGTALRAWRYRPNRAESIYECMLYYQNLQQHKMVVALYILIKDLNVPNDNLFVSTHIYEHQMHYVFSLSAFHTGIKSCDCYAKLFNSEHLNLTNQFNNYRFYYPVPLGVAVNFTTTHVLEGELYYTSSPSIIAVEDKYIMNIRLVNYTIKEDGSYRINGTSISSKNKMVMLNKALDIVGVPIYPISNVKERGVANSPYNYKGIEDIKLAYIEGQLHFTGTICLATHQIGVCYGIYDENVLTPIELQPWVLQQCEKNWVFLPNQKTMVYEWFPLRFGRIENNTLQLAETRTMPKLFQLARGSCNGVEYNNEYWFVVHFVFQHPNELRFYTHSLVILDKNMNLKRYTLPFKFTRPSSIEYCLEIVVEKDRILLSHSVMDRETYVRIYCKNGFDWVDHSSI